MEITIRPTIKGFGAVIDGVTYPFIGVEHLSAYLKRNHPEAKNIEFVNYRGESVATTFYSLEEFLQMEGCL